MDVRIAKAYSEERKKEREKEAQQYFIKLIEKNVKPYLRKYEWRGGFEYETYLLEIILYDENGNEFECPKDIERYTAWGGEQHREKGMTILEFISDLISKGITPQKFYVRELYEDTNTEKYYSREYEGTFNKEIWETIKKKFCECLSS